ncbi:type II secretion system secretin GspD [Pontiella agarivorans]|uniref:Type II secretion system secretin GspD n=1 Tax=Pontiella agarivorans TaxID=3038953 RepID=A0ABU5MUG3_9BACT|nr:type II secretion system secretin GspD [Pontiella agarivorans]MDZ8117849.1 type II secretion system secretin GspD [Pontiella agarivorans]
MNYRTLFLSAIAASTITVLPLYGQGLPPAFPTGRPVQAAPAAPAVQANVPEEVVEQRSQPVQTVTKVAPGLENDLYNFAFEGAPLEVVMEEYCRWTDRIYLKTDAVKANITLRSEKKIPVTEAIKVVEAILAMNNIALVPMGDKYVKVVQATAGDFTGQGLDIQLDPELPLGSGNRFVTRIVTLQNVEIPEVQAAVQHVMHAYGKIMALQRSNSLMITDTEANVKRALEIIDFIDQATAKVESRIYQIQHAEAQEIASKLTEIIDAAQGDEPSPAVTTGNRYARTPPGVIRAGAANNPNSRNAATPTQASIGQTEGASATMIQGTVKVLADERTNIIIIFSQPLNFQFFDEIIKVLDIEVEPATTFEVIHLEYADASDLSGTINDLIGTAGGSSRSSSSSSSRSSSSNSSRSSNTRNTGSSRSTSGTSVTPNAAPAGAPSIENLNRLSEDTKVLADERSNAILLMGSKGDIAVIKQLIRELDIMLEQVIIEAAIFEIGLTDTLRHGIDWLYQASDSTKVGGWDGSSLVGSTNGLGTVASGALTYYQNIAGIDTEVAINLAATDNNARLLATPVIMTTDNTEASLSIGEQRPVVTSTSTYNNSAGTTSSNYEYKDIGIQLTVTPRINPQRFVVMELTQQADQIGGSVTIDGNDVPVILNREFGASIAVPDGGTVALGGLIQTEVSDDVTKIPLLGDIPFIGRYLFSSVTKSETQRELVVLMTPYVIDDISAMTKQTERLYKGTNLRQKDWNGSWSESELRFIPDPVEEDDQAPATQQQMAPTATSADIQALMDEMSQQGAQQ